MVYVLTISFVNLTRLFHFQTSVVTFRAILDLLWFALILTIFFIYSPYVTYEPYSYPSCRNLATCWHHQMNSSSGVSPLQELRARQTSCTLSLIYGPPASIRSREAFVLLILPFSSWQVRVTPDRAHFPPCVSSSSKQSSTERSWRCFCETNLLKYLDQLPEIFLYCSSVFPDPVMYCHLPLHGAEQNLLTPLFGLKDVPHTTHCLSRKISLPFHPPYCMRPPMRHLQVPQ